MSGPRRAAFLDRDGVLNRRPPPHEYVGDARELVVLEGAAEGVRLLREGGFVPIVVSNQRGVARGLVTEATLSEIEERFRAAGVAVERFAYCLHDHADACACRKPEPGMLIAAAEELGLNLAASVMIGDDETDVVAGARAGCHTVRIGSPGLETSAEASSPDLLSAARLVLERWG